MPVTSGLPHKLAGYNVYCEERVPGSSAGGVQNEEAGEVEKECFGIAISCFSRWAAWKKSAVVSDDRLMATQLGPP